MERIVIDGTWAEATKAPTSPETRRGYCVSTVDLDEKMILEDLLNALGQGR